MVRLVKTQHKHRTRSTQSQALKSRKNWHQTTGEITDARLAKNYDSMLEGDGKAELPPFFFTEAGMVSY